MKDEPWISIEGVLYDVQAGQLSIEEAMAEIFELLKTFSQGGVDSRD